MNRWLPTGSWPWSTPPFYWGKKQFMVFLPLLSNEEPEWKGRMVGSGRLVSISGSWKIKKKTNFGRKAIFDHRIVELSTVVDWILNRWLNESMIELNCQNLESMIESWIDDWIESWIDDWMNRWLVSELLESWIDD